jgi:hypothetical protein
MTFMELARQQGKAKVAIAARVGGVLRDLAAQAPSEGNVEWVTIRDPVGIEIMRHSTAHVMAAAVKELFPDARITIGPAIENGFYYDFDVEKPFTPEDIERIEEKMGGSSEVSRGAIQGGDAGRDPGTHRFPLPPGELPRLVPGTASPEQRQGGRIQADEHGGGILERRFPEPDAHAHLRLRLREEK